MYALSETGLPFQWGALIILVLTTGMANGATFALNQYYERHGDAKMERTQSRHIPSGQISPRTALIAGLVVFALGLALQYVLINPHDHVGNVSVWWFICMDLYTLEIALYHEHSGWITTWRLAALYRMVFCNSGS